MPRETIARLLFVTALGLAAPVASADSLRCDGGIVEVGDSKLDLFAKCGEPTLQEAEPLAVTSLEDLGLLVERWTYNFGPNRFIQIVSLQGGRVISIEQGSYGYTLPQGPFAGSPSSTPIPRARCETNAFRVGDRTYDVLARCGEPAFRDLLQGERVIEVWTYDFGRGSFVRFLEFVSGRLIRIRTGSYGYSR
jgi:hypothetical protein